jgi:lysophospholipase L1-like esterase
MTIILAALLGLSWFNVSTGGPGSAFAQSLVDRFDERPVRKILFVGNSRMFFNDMPQLVRKMADSAGSPERYAVTMWAKPGHTLKMHWDAGKVQHLLTSEDWDDFVFQAGSVEHAQENYRADFSYYGQQVAEQALSRDLKPLMIVGWIYGPSEFAEMPQGARDTYYDLIQSDHRSLARNSKVRLVNVGAAFKDLENSAPSTRLMTDGNHPSIEGSYVSALMVYAELAGTDGSEVTYVPRGMTADQAALIRASVAASLRSRI